MHYLANKRILVGVTGSIAAYKSADLVRRLREAGAEVRVAMTENAKRFITPLTLQAVSGHPVHDDLFDLQAEAAMGHIELARWADAVLIAPATADFIARLTHGNANDLLTTLCVATKAPIAVAPAMNQAMWKHSLTQENVQALADRQIHFFGPGSGSQACGDIGFGRMLEPTELLEKLNELFATGLLAGLNVLVTAGPTHEHIDPVRFMTNGSSGKMGYALAQAALEAGAAVSLVSGPVHLAPPSHCTYLPVVSAQEMYETVMRKIAECDIFISVAAVSDYRAETIAQQKIHKHETVLPLVLTRNPDIVSAVSQLARKPFIVGFAAETENMLEQAQAKRQRKNMDMIIANAVQLGMGKDDNAVTIIKADNSKVSLPLMHKTQVARQLITFIANEFTSRKMSCKTQHEQM